MKALVAPGKFKGWLSAAEVAFQVSAELRAVVPDVEAVAGLDPRLPRMQLVLASDDRFRRAS